MRAFPFKKKNPVENLIILAGGLIVVVFAFFAARGDLDVYTSMITGSWIKGSEESISLSTIQKETKQEILKSEKEVVKTPSLQETPISQTIHAELKPQNTVTTSQSENQNISNPPSVSEELSTSKVSTPKSQELQASSVSQKEGYFVQVGAFSKIENAQKMLSLLEELGFTASIDKGNNVYKVRIYGFATFEEAKRVVSKLASQGIEAFASK